MAFLEHHETIFSLICLISIFILFTLKKWRSSVPTNWPLLGMTPELLWNTNRIHDYITDILKETGGTFMFKGPLFMGMDILFTSDPANIGYISCKNFQNYPKGRAFREIFEILGDGIFNCESELWELQRRTTMSLLKGAGFLNLLEETTWDKVEKGLLPVLQVVSEQRSMIDLQDIFQRLTFDVICKLALDQDPERLTIKFPHSPFGKAVMDTEEALLYRHFLPKWSWKLQKLFQIGNEKKLSDASKISDEFIYKYIYEKREALTKRENDLEKVQDEDLGLLAAFMTRYMDQKGTSGDPDKFLKDTLLNLIVAGRDTTSSTLTWFFYLIAKNPIAADTIQEEIHTQLGIKRGDKWRRFCTKELDKLVYLQCALREALRLFPPVAFNHKAPMEPDILPSGQRLNAHTKIIMSTYTMGRMETIWGEDCLEFKPERWFTAKGGIKHEPSHKFIAFHAGPRACLGKEISYMEMKIVVSTVIYNYNVELVEEVVTPSCSVILQWKCGMKVKLSRRHEMIV